MARDDSRGPGRPAQRSARKIANPSGEPQPRKGPQHAPRRTLRPRDGGLRRDLIDAALELVESSGTRGLSLREIARRAGVSHAAPYRHFANKEELLAAVAEQGFRSLAQRFVEQVAAASEEVPQRFEAIAVAYVEFAAENPAHFRVMFGPDVPDIDKHPALREAHDATDGLFRRGVAQVLEETGKIGLELNADHFTLMVWALVHGLASLIVDGRVGDLGESADDPGGSVRSVTGLIETLVEGMKA